MAGEVTLNGTIVENNPTFTLPATTSNGPYLFTEDQRLLALITDYVATQAPKEFLHQRSRSDGKTNRIPRFFFQQAEELATGLGD